MKIEQAFCDTCGAEITGGAHCNACVPGSEQIPFAFTCTGTMTPGGEPSGEIGLQLLSDEETREFFPWLLQGK